MIQGELVGNERMDRERQSILKSALQFVDVMAQGRGASDKSSPSLDVSSEDLQDGIGSITPSPELLYMLLPGKLSRNSILTGSNGLNEIRTYSCSWAFILYTMARSHLKQNTREDGINYLE